MSEGNLPYPDDETESIAPDVASQDERPLKPGEAVKREEERYGDTSLDANRDDQRDEHAGTPDDIV
jgi:hypothetical protein